MSILHLYLTLYLNLKAMLHALVITLEFVCFNFHEELNHECDEICDLTICMMKLKLMMFVKTNYFEICMING